MTYENPDEKEDHENDAKNHSEEGIDLEHEEEDFWMVYKNSKGNSGNCVMLPVCCAPYTSRWSAYTINRVSLDDIQPTKVTFAIKQKCRKLRLI